MTGIVIYPNFINSITSHEDALAEQKVGRVKLLNINIVSGEQYPNPAQRQYIFSNQIIMFPNSDRKDNRLRIHEYSLKPADLQGTRPAISEK